jgi:hypothetical protein
MTVHRMEQIGIDENNLEIWICTKCNRKVLVQWEPEYIEELVFPGDKEAEHVNIKDEEFYPFEWNAMVFWVHKMVELDFESWWTK